MPDITKCEELKCKLKETCYRYTSKPSYHQAYSTFYEEGKDCDYYWPNDEEEELSECCDSEIIYHDLCSECKEHI